MSPEECVLAAEAKVRDAENNLASCVAALNDAKARNGGVPNFEVIALAQAQAALAQAYAALALAKMGGAMLASHEASQPDGGDAA